MSQPGRTLWDRVTGNNKPVPVEYAPKLCQCEPVGTFATCVRPPLVTRYRSSVKGGATTVFPVLPLRPSTTIV